MLEETLIRKVEMRYFGTTTNNLQGMRFFNEKNTMIYAVGQFAGIKVKVVEFTEDERIIGF